MRVRGCQNSCLGVAPPLLGAECKLSPNSRPPCQSCYCMSCLQQALHCCWVSERFRGQDHLAPVCQMW